MKPKVKGFALMLRRSRERKALSSKFVVKLPASKMKEFEELKSILLAGGSTAEEIDELMSKHVISAIHQMWEYARTIKEVGNELELSMSIDGKSV